MIHIFIHSDWLHIDKTSEAVSLFKVSNKDTTGTVQSENIWPCFRIPIDNFKQVSEITSCVYSQISAFFARKTFHSIQHCFHKTNIFTFLDLLALFFYIVVIAADVREGNFTSTKEKFFLQKVTFSNFGELQLKRFLLFCFEVFIQAIKLN